ncbi:hypothetical protein [Halorubrum laminariae]|uniref:Uncharacterized protein n=1 Tax=Halorubrum laminariae TaxID=1433523 RepID=A0ABD6C655_9EURY|nr:hypothetical protein [Halorubrum laminariae]
MGQVRNQTNAALRAYVYEDAGKDQLKQKFRRIEKDVTGANPHNIGMATFEFVSSHSDQTEREIKQILANTFPDHKLPGTFPEKWDGD